MKSLGRPLSPTDIMLTERLGEGQFGDVHKGILYPDVSIMLCLSVFINVILHGLVSY